VTLAIVFSELNTGGQANSNRRQQVVQIANKNAAPLPADVLAADQGDTSCIHQLRGLSQSGDIVGCRRGRQFDLDGPSFALNVDDQIDFVAVARAKQRRDNFDEFLFASNSGWYAPPDRRGRFW